MVAYGHYRVCPRAVAILSLLLSWLLPGGCWQAEGVDREEMIMEPQVDLEGIVNAIMNYITQLHLPADTVDSWRRSFDGERRQISADMWEIGQWSVTKHGGQYFVRKLTIFGLRGQVGAPVVHELAEFTIDRCGGGYAVSDCSIQHGDGTIVR